MTDIVAVIHELVLLLLIALTVILITRRLAVPYTLGLVIVGLLISLFGFLPEIHLSPDLVLFVFLPALLFEGAWSISVQRLRQNWLIILLLAVPGLLVALVLLAVPLHFFAGLNWEDAFLLGAILSPTDPVAVLGLFRQLKVNQDLSTIIEGESLFNDGVAGVLYQTFLIVVLASLGQEPQGGQVWLEGIERFIVEAGGGLVIGAACGFVVSRFVKYIDEPLIETTITIVTAYGVYLLADFFHMSGILAVIVAGLIFGSYGQNRNMSERTREVVDNFWNMVAFLANALLFLLVGAQLNPMQFLSTQDTLHLMITAGLAIAAVLVGRFVMVALLPNRFQFAPGERLRPWRFVIFWSGLRGALSLALVLALPLEVPDRNALIFSTYAVVLFTLLIQGFSLRLLLKGLPGVS
ncbi:sodium:proton antiporter [Ktedonosporobacter rubrisoli]|uniref:Sodium:proton antiporter n=1 Tax=Ktedonosporobacter rubrisoli TaxID=2509675 RepID=A0A4P6JXN9_KTERU|nr:sodium:proton antiporter [Ktedonosporobacter rubrisoli]QBD79786.1 sodium:proton antiporter [Ktedonosporobacter rubrisoli]